ncbi:MAG: Tol-Pal system protein TolB [bacterium]
MKNKWIVVAAILLLSVSSAYAKVYIDINAPTIKRLPIAVTMPVAEPGSDLNDVQLLYNTITNALNTSGYFAVLNPAMFIEKKGGLLLGQFNLSDWTDIGAEGLLKMSYAVKGNTAIVKAYLYDVVQGKSLIAKQYSGNVRDVRYIANSIANDVIYAFTGHPGLAGSKIAFVSKKTGKEQIYAMDLDGSDMVRLTYNNSINLSPVWSPDGNSLLFTSYMHKNPDLYMLNLLSGSLTTLSNRKGLNISPSFSPDGREIAVSLSFSGSPEIYLMNLEGKIIKQLTHTSGINVSPSFSPDGKKIAFVSDRAGGPQIYTMNVDGSDVQRVTFKGDYNASCDWSPNGKRIVFSGLSSDGTFDIYTIKPDGSDLERLTENQGDNMSPKWSPDGYYIIFVSTRDGHQQLYVMNANGSNQHRIIATDYDMSSPSWSSRINFKITIR